MAGFRLFAPVFQKVDSATAAWVGDVSSRVITAITPAVSAGLTLAFIVWGILIMRGVVQAPVREFLGKTIRTAIVVSLALSAGIYQSWIADVIRATPDELAQAVVTDSRRTVGATAAGVIDDAAGTGFDRAAEAFAQAGMTNITMAVIGVLLVLSTVIMVAVGGGFVLVAKVGLAALAGIGPLFIVCLLWDTTRGFFSRWLAMVVNYGLIVVLFAIIFTFMLGIYGGYMADMRFDGVQNVAYAIGGSLVLSIACIVVVLQIPRMAAALSGGVEFAGASIIAGLTGAGVGAALAKWTGRKSAQGAKSGAQKAWNGIQKVASGARESSRGLFRGRGGAASAPAGGEVSGAVKKG